MKVWIVRSHIDWREEQVSTRMLGLERGVDCEISHRLERGSLPVDLEGKLEKKSAKMTISASER